MKNLELGKFYRIKCKGLDNSSVRYYYMIAIEDEDGVPKKLLFSNSDLQRAMLRRSIYRKYIDKYSISNNSRFLHKICLAIFLIMTLLIILFVCDRYS